MASVHANSPFTVVAASGNNALHEIRPRSRKVSQQFLTHHSHRLLTAIDGKYYGGVGESC